MHAPAPLRLAENVLVGLLIAILSFVCSVGNIPLAAVLWPGGNGFAGVIAFVFADLVVLPIIAIYRKYYGTAFAVRIVALMLVTNVLGTAIFIALFALTMRRGATDPVCGMKVDRQSAVTLTRDGATHYFCSALRRRLRRLTRARSRRGRR